MKDALKSRMARRIVRGLLLVVLVLYVVTGFGITQFRTVEAITFGLLTKNLSFQMHEYLWIPFVALFIFHIYQGIGRRNS